MHPNRTIEIWKYRCRKYMDVFLSFCEWISTYLSVKYSKFNSPEQAHIGILLAEHFGDIIACEPLSRELKRLHPKSKIYWIVKKSYRELLDFNPNVDVVIEEYSVFYSMLLADNNSFDYFYNCHLSGLRRYNYLRKKLSNPLAESLNILTDNYFNYGNILEIFAKVGGLPVLKDAPKIYIPDIVRTKIDNLHFSKKVIVVHCHSNYSPKDWQVHYWEKLVIDIVNECNYNVVEIGLESTLNVYHSDYYNFCGQLSLLETAQLIKRADYFIGIDSGPAHFANAVGTFGFLLFGKLGEFENYMPYSGDYQTKTNAKFIIKEGQPCSELEYDKVWNAISETIQVRNLVERN